MARNTKARTGIVQIFKTSPSPLTLSQVLKQVHATCPTVVFSTVYRVVGRLHREGKVRQVEWQGKNKVYEWAYRSHHHHLICDECGQIEDITDATVGFSSDAFTRQTGYKLIHHTIELTGTCPTCQEKT